MVDLWRVVPPDAAVLPLPLLLALLPQPAMSAAAASAAVHLVAFPLQIIGNALPAPASTALLSWSRSRTSAFRVTIRRHA